MNHEQTGTTRPPLTTYPWPDDPQMRARAAAAPLAKFPLGHFYNTIPDTRELVRDEERIWPDKPYDNPAIDWRGDEQRELAGSVFAQQQRLEFPEGKPADDQQYFTENDQYPALDAWILEAMIRHFEPGQIIEAGSGFSTLVVSQSNRDCFSGEIIHECVEPYPPAFLQRPLAGVNAIHPLRIQDTPLERFDVMAPGDIFFVDSTHTVKTGGDVHWIFSRVLPRLRPGVLVHFHDIYVPGEYPKRWALDGWGWNETYLMEAFLSYNSVYEVVFSAQWMLLNAPAELLQAFPGLAERAHGSRGGSSLWLRRRDS